MARIITIHQPAASGGTIFARAIAAMPNVVLLSEIHPDRHLSSSFHPLHQIEAGYDLIGAEERLSFDEHFLDEISLCSEICSRNNKTLVIRDHAHRDFFDTDSFSPRLLTLLSKRFEVYPLVTMRDPVDIWLSWEKTKWFSDRSIDEFCRRLHLFLECYSAHPLIRYEDFIQDPDTILAKVCDLLGIGYTPDYQNRMAEIAHLTGDSGRSGLVIRPRPRRPIRPVVKAQLSRSYHYHLICDQVGYSKVTRDKGKFRNLRYFLQKFFSDHYIFKGR